MMIVNGQPVGQDTSAKAANSSWLVRWVVPVALSAMAVSIGVFTWNFHNHDWGGPGDFAQFGDYMGGVLNPMLGFLTIVLLVRQLDLQRKEFNVAIEEMKQNQKDTQASIQLAEQQAQVQASELVRVREKDEEREAYAKKEQKLTSLLSSLALVKAHIDGLLETSKVFERRSYSIREIATANSDMAVYLRRCLATEDGMVFELSYSLHKALESLSLFNELLFQCVRIDSEDPRIDVYVVFSLEYLSIAMPFGSYSESRVGHSYDSLLEALDQSAEGNDIRESSAKQLSVSLEKFKLGIE
ncbi:hypothetical protein [Ferrimonas balearica]|uniref:hypothetical protein n=1 Tax=Ferrimonas balearica TaxID=44012 RepID=UPI001C94733B|nr:hypothetical protein [Ferrimonas balearica]MBY6223549.1 hypothetical protein [Ferrimonas balearica]